jgi:hypothetical protein
MRGNGWEVFDSHGTEHAQAAASGDPARFHDTTKITNRLHTKVQHIEAHGLPIHLLSWV